LFLFLCGASSHTPTSTISKKQHAKLSSNKKPRTNGAFFVEIFYSQPMQMFSSPGSDGAKMIGFLVV
jgi:hypothetical protein